MEQTFITATAVTMALVETVKRVVSNPSLDKFIPVATLVVGFAVSMSMGFEWLTSLLVGLSANGTYSVAKPVIKPTVNKVEDGIRKVMGK